MESMILDPGTQLGALYDYSMGGGNLVGGMVFFIFLCFYRGRHPENIGRVIDVVFGLPLCSLYMGGGLLLVVGQLLYSTGYRPVFPGGWTGIEVYVGILFGVLNILYWTIARMCYKHAVSEQVQ